MKTSKKTKSMLVGIMTVMVCGITALAVCHGVINYSSGSYLCSSSPCGYTDVSPDLQLCGAVSDDTGYTCGSSTNKYVISVFIYVGGNCDGITCSGGNLDRSGYSTNNLPVLTSCGG